MMTQSQNTLNKNLEYIRKYGQRKQATKMHFSRKCGLFPDLTKTFNKNAVETFAAQKYLGLCIDSILNFKTAFLIYF